MDAMKMLLAVLLGGFALVSCAERLPTDPTSVKRSELPREWPKAHALATAWGMPSEPRLSVLGVPTVTYSNPKLDGGYVRVSYLGKAKPMTITSHDGRLASDGKLFIMGRTVDFYHSGNEGPEISTQPMLLTSPSGWTGWYAFSFASKEHLAGKNLPAFTW